MSSSFELTQKERIFVDDHRKTILIRPKGEEPSVGDVVFEEALEVYVINVRHYPTIKDLLQIENLEHITTNAKDIVEALNEFENKYEGFDCKGFCAIEVALQD